MCSSLVLTLLGALLLCSGARPVTAAAPCVSVDRDVVTSSRPQVISDTLQTEPNMFICRVDGAGTQRNAPGTGTRSVTPVGLMLLVVARWLHFIGYALGFGTIAFGLWSAMPGNQIICMSRLWRLAHIGIVLLLSAEPLALLAQTIGVRGVLFDPAVAGDVLASGFGLVWAQRVGVALLLWVIIGVVKDGTLRALWAVPLLGILLAMIDAIAGAAGAALPGVAIAAATLHEAAMGVWLGGLALLLGLWNRLDHDQRAAMLARFRSLSIAAIGVLSVTGLVMATIRLTQPADLLATFYGGLLSIKLLVALLAIALVLFGQQMYRVLWRGRVVLAALIIVLGVASLLVSVPTP